MQAVLVCDDLSIGRAVRQVLLHEGVDSPMSSLISYDQASRRLATDPPELIVAILPGDPLRSVEALEILSGIPHPKETLVIAVGPAADTKLVIRALRGIVDDYVDVDEIETELASALESWRRRSVPDRPQGRVVAVLGPSGGAGSSTIAASLAVLVARQHKSAALVDLKLETGDLAALLDLKPTHSLADLCKNVDRLDQVLFQRSLVGHASGVQLLSPPRLLADVEYVSPEGIRQAIGLARALFPFVVVDLDHNFREVSMQVLRQADVILMAFRLDFPSLRNTNRFLEHLDGLGVPMDRVRLVVSRSGLPREIPVAKAEEALKGKIFHAIPDDPKAVGRANNHGVPVVLDAPSARVSKSLAKLAELIQAPPRPSAPAVPAPHKGRLVGSPMA